MKITETKLKDCFILEPHLFKDDRGYFFESFNQKQFNNLIGKSVTFVQDNESFSTKGVVRGLHFQTGYFAQAKLVRAVKGAVLDVAVDLRPKSPTFGKHISIELTEENKKQLFVPRGFAHGFAVLSKTAIFSYKCDNYYNKKSEAGIMFNDPTLNINWKLSNEEILVSEKDADLPTLKEYF
ncbi:dTDP-4-dehydrorhamnose 3,5-epimerase [Mangrovimonas cancribranchiae]|uniref:dTDP-4-dehydrorhamnose 3,5-epimerase n=1 Tax=Mangrovimonas cancribranchiae TaxID=3080055 RepID=A0AAU6NVX5_9FLAO